MSFYIVPKIDANILKYLNSSDNITDYHKDDSCDNDLISKTLKNYLFSMKHQIDKHIDKWDLYKKYTNPYEYIHTNIPHARQSICSYKPLSRSFFKMIEVINIHDLLKNLTDINIKTYHLAEGPGGFIEAVAYLRKNKNDLYYGQTLIDNSDNNVPGWKKSNDFLKKNRNVKIITGNDNTGNLLCKENLKYCYDNFKNSIDIITGDGGIDFSNDFNQQEKLAINLIFAQVCYAIIMQKQGGHFVIKIFDIFNKSTLEIIYLLASLYDRVYITKPHSSRYANSEKYIVCKGFRIKNSDEFYHKFYSLFENNIFDKFITNILTNDIPVYFVNKIEEINSIIGHYQIENINSTINLIINNVSGDKLENIKNANIQKCLGWCNKHKLPVNSISDNKYINSSNVNSANANSANANSANANSTKTENSINHIIA